MAIREKLKLARKIRRKARVRAKISGTKERPRLSVFRSLKHINAQLIDDVASKTLVSANDLQIKGDKMTKAEVSEKVGELLAQKATKAGITAVLFDKGSSKFHGRVKAVAQGARKGGLKF